MIRVIVSKVPNLKLKMPNSAFYRGVGTQVAKKIRKRTESDHVDYQGQQFAEYTPSYEAYRAEKGRSTTPNLSFTGQMLGAMQVKAERNGASISLTGQQGLKAWGNEQRGRVFFRLSTSEQKAVFAQVDKWIIKNNLLTR